MSHTGLGRKAPVSHVSGGTLRPFSGLQFPGRENGIPLACSVGLPWGLITGCVLASLPSAGHPEGTPSGGISVTMEDTLVVHGSPSQTILLRHSRKNSSSSFLLCLPFRDSLEALLSPTLHSAAVPAEPWDPHGFRFPRVCRPLAKHRVTISPAEAGGDHLLVTNHTLRRREAEGSARLPAAREHPSRDVSDRRSLGPPPRGLRLPCRPGVATFTFWDIEPERRAHTHGREGRRMS